MVEQPKISQRERNTGIGQLVSRSPYAPMCRVCLYLNSLTFCLMVTNEVVLHELCMFDEMMDIQLSSFCAIASL
jgi:hypothetical protein